MPTIPVATLEQLTRDVFTARDVPTDDAAWVATLLVRANCRGHDSHGVIRVPHYVRAMKAGEVNPRPKIAVESETSTIALVDGDLGFGQVVARRGIAIAIEKARAQGLSAVTLKRTNHVGRLADWAETAANPHAVAIPGPGGTVAMSHDFATSVVAEGKLKVKFNRGEKAAPGIMINAAGHPSTDPREFYADPPGALLTAGEHKGYGLSLAIEILGGILSGTGAARPTPGPVQNGTLIICLDPARFLAAGDFHAQVTQLFGFVRSAPLAPGSKEVLVPGEPEARLERERRAVGVPLDDETWRQLRECASEAGVA